MKTSLDLKIIDRLTGGKLGRFDLPCPACGPLRRRPANQRKTVLRIWCIESGFATYHCAAALCRTGAAIARRGAVCAPCSPRVVGIY
jgi:hypothetical protein